LERLGLSSSATDKWAEQLNFRIADTFTDSLAKLGGDEQKAVKTTAFDLQLNPAQPGMQFHKLERGKDPNFWSVRVSRDIRLIVHRTSSSLLLCYAAHHDEAYRWAERRKLETHPRTGAAQFVEIRETVKEITVPRYVAEKEEYPSGPPPLLTGVADAELLGYGVPPEWLGDVRAATEGSILDLAEHLPTEAAEAVLALATGTTPEMVCVPSEAARLSAFPSDTTAVAMSPDQETTGAAAELAVGSDAFEHPDARRHFRTIVDREELERALEFPWEKWAVFLHPAQREWVERDYNGPARLFGSAGTGKTIVALHRAVFLARTNPDARVLLTTFSETLAQALGTQLRRLIRNEPRLGERIEVHAIDAIGQRLYEAGSGGARIAPRAVIKELLANAGRTLEGRRVSDNFLLNEWEEVVDAWQLDTREAYRDIRRLGRKTRLSESRRTALWSVFAEVHHELDARGLITRARMFSELAERLAGRRSPIFDFAVVDEAQDLSVTQLRFLAALAGAPPNGLFFAGDLGQRIFQQPFSWKALGVEVQGRSRTLKINYHTSHQIRMQCDRLLAPEVADVDGNVETRRGTVSVFNGPAPELCILDDPEQEREAVGGWLAARIAEGLHPKEIGVFVRSEAELERAQAAADQAGLKHEVLDEHMATVGDRISLSTMHLAKGLEFRAVAVMACDDEIIPLQSRIESIADEADLEEVYNTERHLLYVACTRARDRLLISGVEPASEFLEDLRG